MVLIAFSRCKLLAFVKLIQLGCVTLEYLADPPSNISKSDQRRERVNWYEIETKQ